MASHPAGLLVLMCFDRGHELSTQQVSHTPRKKFALLSLVGRALDFISNDSNHFISYIYIYIYIYIYYAHTHILTYIHTHLSFPHQARILVGQGKLDEALALVQDSGDALASLYIATQLEHSKPPKVEQAIELYAQAQMHQHALRLVKKHGLDSKLEELVRNSDNNTQLDAARHFESKGAYEKAIRLYR